MAEPRSDFMSDLVPGYREAAKDLDTRDLVGVYRYLRGWNDRPDLPARDDVLSRVPEDEYPVHSGAALSLLLDREDVVHRDLDPLRDKPKLRLYTAPGDRVTVEYDGASAGGPPKPGAALEPLTSMPLDKDLVFRVDAGAETAQTVGILAEHALRQFKGFGFRVPERVLIKLFSGYSINHGKTNPAIPWVEVSCSLGPREHARSVPHEVFHRVQYQYLPTRRPGRDSIRSAVIEGGARLAEDCIWDVPKEYVDSGIFRPDASLLDRCQGRNVAYAYGVLWKYFAEQHGQRRTSPGIGIDAYRRILEAVPVHGYTVEAIRAARKSMADHGSFDDFTYAKNPVTGARELVSAETTWGNFAVAGFLHKRRRDDARFVFLDDDKAFERPGAGAPLRLGAMGFHAEPIPDSGRVRIAPWSVRCFEVPLGPSPDGRMLTVKAHAGRLGLGGVAPLTQILCLGAGFELRALHRSDQSEYRKDVLLTGLARVVVVVAARGSAVSYSLGVSW